MSQSETSKRIIIFLVGALFLLLMTVSMFLFLPSAGNQPTTNPQVQNTTSSTKDPRPCAGGHNYVEGKCSVCGVKDVNYIPTIQSTQPSQSVKPTNSSSTKRPSTSSSTKKPTTPSSTTKKPTQSTNPPVDVNGTFTITENGKGKATVVISQNYSSKTLAAANDLLDYIYKISGAELDFVYDDGTLTNDRFYILVGPSKFTKQLGVQQPTGYPDNEMLIVKRVKNALVLLGNDDGAFTGTEFAVTRFLEELGCGWYGTAALWQVVPNNPSISIEQMNIVETPKFISRSNRLMTFNAKTKEIGKRWYMGGVETHVGQHFLMAYIDVLSYRGEHPEWYAKNSSGGYQEPSDGWWQFCYSNSSLHQKVAQVVKDYFASHPNCMVFSITPNDGSTVKICKCSGCSRYSSDTDLILDFANAVSRIVKQTYPDRYVNILSYAPTVFAPSASHPVDSNVEIMFCTETYVTKPSSTAGFTGMHAWRKWTPWATNMQNYISRTGVQHIAIWKWLCIAANPECAAWANIPWVQGNVATQDHEFWKSKGATYVFYDQGPLAAYREYDNSFPLRWPLWYVANRGCWTQGKTGEELLQDACNKLYGNGADAMMAYYRALANASASSNGDSVSWVMCSPSAVYTSSQISIINSRVAGVRAVLNSVTPEQAQRMQNQINLWENAKNYI